MGLDLIHYCGVTIVVSGSSNTNDKPFSLFHESSIFYYVIE